jgi:ABC-type branched-subunit amino acid transport system substrate-binding protein
MSFQRLSPRWIVFFGSHFNLKFPTTRHPHEFDQSNVPRVRNDDKRKNENNATLSTPLDDMDPLHTPLLWTLCSVPTYLFQYCGHDQRDERSALFGNNVQHPTFPSFLLSSPSIIISHISYFLHLSLLAIDDINNKTNGVLDHLLPHSQLRPVIRYCDDEFYDAAVNAHTTMIVDSKGIIAALGSTTLETMKGSSPVYEQFGEIPVVSYGERNSLFGNYDLYPNLLRVIPPDYYDGYVLASVISQFFRWKKVSVFYTSTDLGRGCFKLFNYYASMYGIDILTSHSLDASQEDYTAEVMKAKHAGARILVIFVEGDIAVRIIQQGGAVQFRNSIQVLAGERMSPQYWAQYNMTVENTYVAGLIGAKLSYFAPSSALKQHFLHRWQQQHDTLRVINGTTECEPERDFYNQTDLYQYFPNDDTSAAPVCTGVEFSKSVSDPSVLLDLDEVMSAYDAVLAIAYGLDDLISRSSIPDPSPAQLHSRLLNTSFQGLTGLVSFSTALKLDGFNVGGRAGDFTYDIFNFAPKTSLNDSFPIVATWSSRHGIPPCQNISYYVDGNPCYQFLFVNGGTTIISDSPDPVKKSRLPFYYRIILKVPAVCGVFLTVLAMLITYTYQKRRLVKMSQPILSYVTMFGIIVGFVRVFLSTHRLTASRCVAQLWFDHLPIQIIFGAVLIRAWRVHNITASLQKKKITDLMCAGHLLKWLAPALLFLVLATIDESIHVHYTTVVHNQYDWILQPSCDYSRTGTLLTLLYLYDALTIVVGLFWCWRIRAVRSTICNTPMLVQGMSQPSSSFCDLS